MLHIEVEYLTGVARAADDRGDGADWPPQPDRLFSALTASWAARGETAAERAALEWLERQDPPAIACTEATARDGVPVFVPPNDDSGTALTVLPTRRRRQDRRFPASVPDSPVVRFVWATEPETAVLAALDGLARATSSLGHSASLVRCRALQADEPDGPVRRPRRTVYPGRLAELEHRHRVGDRPAPGVAVPPIPAIDGATAPASVFGPDWIVFGHAGEPRPDAVAGAIACKALLRTVLAGYGERPVPAWVSGHAPDGAPLSTPHLAAVPLLDAGGRWSQGRLMGLALVPPRDVTQAVARARDPAAHTVARADVDLMEQETGLLHALREVRDRDQDGFGLVLRLPGGLEWRLARDPAETRRSLRPETYAGPATTWGTVTPIALDRHPKKDGDVADIIGDACARIGLPRPAAVAPAKHAALQGAPSARASGHAPPWTGWRRPDSVATRRLTHAVLRFPEPVAGPVILGAGRFVGLGLCRPLDRPSDRPPRGEETA
ncbi:type I-G CRISPR-associated protein Csb2 [Roseospira goensis]|uniref:CRISPR-associated protein Csb2 n=1 Tax=Roseospira goensis TaxID=391922 RepID=A0A7W6RZJ9_9PROT|nr:type I-U CRISPR-associated protein Csb2 [Roseospira goensis]MBB4286133.1 CRISPR-associated protein Csb2 [Roseospira goensis]